MWACRKLEKWTWPCPFVAKKTVLADIWGWCVVSLGFRRCTDRGSHRYTAPSLPGVSSTLWFRDPKTNGIPTSAQSLLCLRRILHFLQFPVAPVAHLACQHSTQGSGGMVFSRFRFRDFLFSCFLSIHYKDAIASRRWTVDFLFLNASCWFLL